MRPTAVLLAVAWLAAAAAPVPPATREDAYRANNRGVALLEQYRPADAVAQFRKALELDPGLPLARANLGVALLNVPDLQGAEAAARAAIAAGQDTPQTEYVLALAARGQNEVADAEAALRKVLAADPADVGALVNLGQLILQQGRPADAIAPFRAAVEAAPHNATALYNLGLATTRAGHPEEGQALLERFRVLRDSGAGTLIGQSYPEQGRYAEAAVSTGAEAEVVSAATPAARFVDATAAAGLGAAPAGSAAAPGRVTLLDLDGDGDLDLASIGPEGLHVWRNDAGRFADATTALGIEPGGAGTGVVGGDVDGDGRPDLLVLRPSGVQLLVTGANGLADRTAAAGLAGITGATTAALADFDHDGDLDAFVGGAGASRLLQNTGAAVFKDVSDAAHVHAPDAVGAVATDYDNGRDMDLFAAGAGALQLFRNQRDTTFRDVAAEAGLPPALRATAVAAGDVNKDTFTDFFLGSPAGDVLASSDGRGRFIMAPAPGGTTGSTAALFADYDGDGLLDVVSASPRGMSVWRNLGTRWADVGTTAIAGAPAGVVSMAAGDLDGDGDTDLVVRLQGGALRLLRNEGGGDAGSVTVRLAGRVSNKSGIGAKVELRAGSLTQKLELAASTPNATPADVVFGLGGRGTADAVRVLWPSGTLQTELDPTTAPTAARSAALFSLTELDRKPSSCPYLYAWDGQRFRFVTDFMGGGEMGYLEAPPATWNEPDPVEYTRLTDLDLKPRDGRLEIRVTNELEEAMFVDRLALVAVAHPAEVEVYPNEGMTTPPKPDRLFALAHARPPASARDDAGRDVLDLVARVDGRAPDEYRPARVRGYADRHSLVLDLGAPPAHAALVLTGWTDYAWSSDNLAAAQAGLTMDPPVLQVEDARGAWVTADEALGIPVGRPQSIVVDLAGAWRSASRRVRLTSTMQIHWDAVRVAEVLDTELRPVTLDASLASLRERGFSLEAAAVPGGPLGYDYTRVSQSSPWKAFPGRYTRQGDVRELLARTDDVFVVSAPGDELALQFDARALPPLPSGWRRTYLLLSDGFSKEMDLHSATPDALGPRPFHGMSRYPYAPPEAFPMTKERRAAIDAYETRVVRSPVPPIDTALLREGPR